MDRTDANSLTYPQAWLTGLGFDVNGDMVLGIRDRFGDQMGYGNRKPMVLSAPEERIFSIAIRLGKFYEPENQERPGR